MTGWGLTLLVIGLGSFVLPFFGHQFVIVSALGPNGGIISIGVGIALLVFGTSTGGSASAGPIVQAKEQVVKQPAESLVRLEAAERAADRAQENNAKLLELITKTISDIESRGAVADSIAPLRAECNALQAQVPAPFREALAEPYEQFEGARDDAAQEALVRKLLERHTAHAAAGRAWRKRAEQLNHQALNLSLPKRKTPRA